MRKHSSDVLHIGRYTCNRLIGRRLLWWEAADSPQAFPRNACKASRVRAQGCDVPSGEVLEVRQERGRTGRCLVRPEAAERSLAQLVPGGCPFCEAQTNKHIDVEHACTMYNTLRTVILSQQTCDSHNILLN